MEYLKGGSLRQQCRPLVDPLSKYHSTISPKLDRCISKMINLKPKNRQQSIWDLISELEILPNDIWLKPGIYIRSNDICEQNHGDFHNLV